MVKKITVILLLILSIALLPNSVNAYDIANSGIVSVNGGQILCQNANAYYDAVNGAYRWQDPNRSAGNCMQFNAITDYAIPANSIITATFAYDYNPLVYKGFAGNGYSAFLGATFSNVPDLPLEKGSRQIITARWYIRDSINNIYFSRADNYGDPVFTQTSVPSEQAVITLSGISYVTLAKPLSANDLNQITNVLAGLGHKLDQIGDRLDFSNQQSANMVSQNAQIIELLKKTNEQQQSQIDKENDALDKAEQAGKDTTSEDFQIDSSTSVGVVSGVLDEIKNVENGSCTFPDITWNGMVMAKGGNVCLTPLPPWITIITTIVTGYFTVVLVFNTIHYIIYYITSDGDYNDDNNSSGGSN